MDVVRSRWEESIEAYVKGKYPALRIESNNRGIIPSRQTRSFKLEIDIFIPELSLGIEVNGEQYHNREKYLNDREYGTTYSDEMYKEKYCKSVGIELVQVWSSEGAGTIHRKIDGAVQRRLSDPTISQWRPAGVGSETMRELASVLSIVLFGATFIGVIGLMSQPILYPPGVLMIIAIFVAAIFMQRYGEGQ